MSVHSHGVIRLVLAGTAAVAGLTGCTRSPASVGLPAPTPTGDAASACAALVSSLAHDVGSLARRDVTPTSPYSAAWGDPAVTLRCGLPPHVPNSADSEVDAAGLTWRVRSVGDYVQWDATGLVTGVEVRVPLSDTAQEVVLSDLGKAVRTAIPAVTSDSPSAGPTG